MKSKKDYKLIEDNRKLSGEGGKQRYKPAIAVDAITLYKGSILFIERKKAPFGWAFPGGHLEPGESLEQALVRELKEETNLDVNKMYQFKNYSDPNRDPRGRVISTVFVVDAYGRPKAQSDAKNFKLISLDQIDSMKNDFAFDHYTILNDYIASLEPGGVQTNSNIMLWQAHYMSEYYDNDPRMPGIVPVDKRFYVVADSYNLALEKILRANPGWNNLGDKEELQIMPIDSRSLKVARNSKKDGRMRFIAMQYLNEIGLSLEEDKRDYELKVVLEEKN